MTVRILVLPVLLSAAALIPTLAIADSITGPGVTDTTITLGYVAPITGLGINYGTAFEDAANAYWKAAAAKGHKIAGRTVKVVAQDDQFRPDMATQVCSRLAETAFLITGWQGGGNQKACAIAATRGGAAYVTRGFDPSVGEAANFFATSPTTLQDGEILTRFIASNMGGKGTKVQFVSSNAPAGDALVQAFESGAKKNGLEAAPAVRVALAGQNAEITASALRVQQSGTQVVAMSLPPAALSTVFAVWNTQGYHPKMILYVNDQQASYLCETLKPEQTAALYAPSPWPTPEYVEKQSPGFRAAFKDATGREPNSVDVSVWATMELVDHMFKVAGPDITREGFLAKVGNTTIQTPLMGPITYKPGDHQGATSQYMLKLSCQDKLFQTSGKVGL